MNLSAGYPLSLVRYGMPNDYPKVEENISTEVVIMGGGISGALVSYYLTNAGIENIVTDARTIGLGSTCASTSLLQYEIDTPLCELQHKAGLYNAVRAYRLCDEAIDTLESIAQKIKFSDFEKKKSLYFAAAKADTAFIKEEHSIRKLHGFNVELLTDKEIKKEFSFDAPSAILSAQGAETNAYTFTHALHRYSIKKGARVFDRSCITDIKHSKNGVKLQTENGCRISARFLIYATGYEGTRYIDKKIVSLSSTFAVCSEQGKENEVPFKDKAMLWNTANPYLYLRATADNRIIIGGRDEKFSTASKRDEMLDAKKTALVKDFEKLFPKISFKPEFSWCGTFGATKDGLPFIGEYPHLPNGYFSLGYGGNGITFSLIAAEILTDMITGKKNLDKEIFGFDRL